jgi:hypothetical protein
VHANAESSVHTSTVCTWPQNTVHDMAGERTLEVGLARFGIFEFSDQHGDQALLSSHVVVLLTYNALQLASSTKCAALICRNPCDTDVLAFEISNPSRSKQMITNTDPSKHGQ